MRGVPVGCD
uniref:Uncharacterized protein n=1 Tax=Anguilla anguilla TaxID=7936 RepID=A0A0E9RXP6_ANGAN